ncbi:AAA family ATPase [Brachyspira sp.]|uniref:AAA family ATPase n=1 Tax=Brachyspira sp. TaxID=1977261 RepID=UPI003D7E4787
MFDKNNIYIYIAILLNAIIIALFITFVFGLKRDAFDVDTKKLDRSALICQNSVLNIVNEYDKRINKILESYPFADFLQRVVINGVDKSERDKIISIFRSGNYAFDTVTINLAIDGKTVISSPDKNKVINIDNYKNSNALAYFDEDYDGVYFIKSISNENGIRIGYIVASVFKKIFENTSYNLNFVVLPNGVVYYNPAIDINSISRDTLTRYMEQSDSKTINIDNSSYLLYSGRVRDIENFSIGILELNVPIVQKYLKYILLLILCSSFIFLIISVLYDRNKLIKESQTDDIYEEDENYNINSINVSENNNEDTLELLTEDDINYLNDIDLEDIFKEDSEEKNNNENYTENNNEEETEEKLNLDDLENFEMPEDGEIEENKNEENNNENNLTNITNEENSNDTGLDDLEELYNSLEELEKLDEKEDDIIESIDDMENIINDEEDILISHGSIIEEELMKKEDEYFSSSDAFNFSLNKDFLLGDKLGDKEDLKDIDLDSITDNYEGEIVKKADESDTFDKEDLKDEELYNPDEVPKVPESYYKEAEEKVKENMTAYWKNILKSIRGKKFVNKNMSEILDWIKEESGLDITNCAMLNKGEDGIYKVAESQNLSEETKESLKIDENEGLFKKILSNNRTLYVSDPFSSDSLKEKFDIKDRENIYHMIFVPIQNEEGELKSFFIGLSTN